jgi:CDP-diacylglycerol---serine O-phosphatidyltransferase
MKHIPNVFTLLNLFFGCLAIIFVLQPGEGILTYGENEMITTLPERITWGCVCLGLAALVDFLDGFVARLFKASSEMGAQLDSLADAVSFGAAPGMIVYQLLRISYAEQADGIDISMAYLLPAILIPCAAVYRLAKFNLDKRQTYGFIGVPTPAAGLLIASLPLIIHYNSFGLAYLFYNKWFLYVLILVLCWLMVSELPIMAMKFKDFSVKNNLPKYILAGLAIICALVFHWVAVPIVFIAYILLSLIFKNLPQ